MVSRKRDLYSAEFFNKNNDVRERLARNMYENFMESQSPFYPSFNDISFDERIKYHIFAVSALNTVKDFTQEDIEKALKGDI